MPKNPAVAGYRVTALIRYKKHQAIKHRAVAGYRATALTRSLIGQNPVTAGFLQESLR